MRSDLQIVQLPAILPNWGGLLGRNKINVDPDFGCKIVRVTDASDNKGQSLMTADGAGANIWNKNDTMLLVKAPGGGVLIYQFNPSTMQSKQLPYKYNGKYAFSGSQPGVLFGLEGTVVKKLKFAFVGGTWVYKNTTDVCDFAHCLPAGFKLNWQGSFGGSNDDSQFTVGFSEGVQNSAIYACVWHSGHGVGKGYRVFNTETGQISGDWGEIGQVRLVSPDAKVPFTLHECSSCPNSEYSFIGPHNAGNSLIWHTPMLDIQDIGVSGHKAGGLKHLYAGGPGGGQILEVEYADVTKRRLVCTKDQLPAGQTDPSTGKPQQYDGDRHYAFGKFDPNDNSIFWVSGQTDASTANGRDKPFTSCWMNEVVGYEAQTGVVHRACHTGNSGLSEFFIVQHAIAVPSPSGHFVAFASDMQGGCGSKNGTDVGIPGTDARGDVFVVRVG